MRSLFPPPCLSDNVSPSRTPMENKKHPKKPEFWIYFWGGLVLGAGLGAWISWGMYRSRWAFFAQTGAIALVTGYLAGKWQDPFWPW
ncbi:MAG: hypothetical protein C5B50_26530, partial [Verrucomicrobia bacterium]